LPLAGKDLPLAWWTVATGARLACTRLVTNALTGTPSLAMSTPVPIFELLRTFSFASLRPKLGRLLARAVDFESL
jgi:hypothetical protein